jgi:peptide chain release factor 1
MSASPLRPDLTGFRRRLAELEALMADPATFADNRRAAALGAELRFTSKAVKADDALVALEKELAESRALAGEADAEIRAMAAEEIARLEPAVEVAREQLIRSIIPVNPDDSRNALVEIRAGTGGEEASLFAAELLRAYTRFAEKKGWKCELMSLSHSDLGAGGRYRPPAPRGRRPPRPARTRYRGLRTRPHLGRHGRGPPRSRRSRSRP